MCVCPKRIAQGRSTAKPEASWQRGGRLVHRRGAHRDRREPPAEARHQAEEVAEQPHLALGHRTPRKKYGQQERGRNAREGRHEARPLNGRETLLGELDREPDRRKEGGRVEQHRNVRGVRVLEAERHEEEFARKAQAHLEGVRELHVHVPLLPEPEAVGTPEQEGRAARAQGHLHQGADVGRARLDGGLLKAPDHAENHADEEGPEVYGTMDVALHFVFFWLAVGWMTQNLRAHASRRRRLTLV